jgi:hypothetical protein
MEPKTVYVIFTVAQEALIVSSWKESGNNFVLAKMLGDSKEFYLCAMAVYKIVPATEAEAYELIKGKRLLTPQ